MPLALAGVTMPSFLKRAGSFANLFAAGFVSATLIDAEKFCNQFLPEALPQEFGDELVPSAVGKKYLV